MIETTGHRGWHSRGYLPHLDEPGRVQVITFRLVDSLPRALVELWADELAHMQPGKANLEKTKRVADALDRGIGECWLRDPLAASMVERALLFFDGERYRILAWCVMPNHVHALIMMMEGYPLEGSVHSWKRFTARQCNQLLGRSGSFWARDYYDRFIRNEMHLRQAAEYIENNPVAAGLAKSPVDWPWSSARFRVTH